MNREMNEARLSEEMRAVRFALIELGLYLDTHPESAEALAAFSEHNSRLAALKAQYVRHYGPLMLTDVSGANGWTWGASPMPWEGGN